MLSHFLADACMPCHCDRRPLAGYDNGLHRELEQHWHDLIDDSIFDKDLLKSQPAAAYRLTLGCDSTRTQIKNP